MKIGNYFFKKGDMFTIWVDGLHSNPEEWREPEKFVPERFDPASEWSLRPDGKKRNPYSFLPFNSGKRSCFGKTFAECAARINLFLLVSNFEFDFVDEKHMTEFPPAHIGCPT